MTPEEIATVSDLLSDFEFDKALTMLEKVNPDA
jgi:hypothetical protein